MDVLKISVGTRSSKIGLSLIVYATIWFGLGATRLWDRDEPRNARCAVEMLERNDWIVPMFNGELRTHKPILLYWLQMPSMAILGQTDFAARLGSALMASITIGAIYLFAKKTIDIDVGFWSAAILATSLMFVVAARAATPDACLISTSTIGILLIAFHWQTNQNNKTWIAYLGYASLGLAMLAKGPVGFVLPMIVLCIWGFVQAWNEPAQESLSIHWLRRTWTAGWKACKRLRILDGMVLAVPWYVCVGMRTNGEWLRGFFFEHNLGRAINAMEGHQGGWWFYPAASLVGLFPWSMLLIPILIWTAKNIRNRPHSAIIQLGVIWMLVYVVLFSLAKTKLPSYITPCYPGAALCIGGFVADWSRNRNALSLRWLVVGAFFFALIGSSIIGGLIYASFDQSLPRLSWQGVWASGFLAVAAAMVLNARRLLNAKPAFDLTFGLLAAAVLFLGGLWGVASPTVGGYRNDVDAIVALDQDFSKASPNAKSSWCSVRTIEPSWVYYLERPIKELAIQNSPRTEENDEAVMQVVRTLQSENGRAIINGGEIELWKLRLRPYGLNVVPIAEFRTFLKNEAVAVIACARPEIANHAESSVDRFRKQPLPTQLANKRRRRSL
jgi:4-amino-4-deoxy-L-arabinose transferase-like glycosyltransferase